MENKTLTQEIVNNLGLNKVSVITDDMLSRYTSIGSEAFRDCTDLTSITIPDSVKNIGRAAFYNCSCLTSVTIGNTVKSIGAWAFWGCISLTSITIPNSVTSIGMCAFSYSKVASVTIGNIEYKTQEVIDGKCKAYKAFNANMTCHGFQYEEGKTYEFDGDLKLCKNGFHACLKLLKVFNFYSGKLGKDVVVHEVELEGISDEYKLYSGQVVARKITIGKRVL